MTDTIRFQGHTYILATSPRVATRTLTLKEGDSFAVFDRYGDSSPIGSAEQGIFHKGTRMLSQHEFRFGQQRPLLLSSTVHERNAFLAVDLTNPDIPLADGTLFKRGSIHIFRSLFLFKGALYSRVRLHNYGEREWSGDIGFLFASDFADLFEVRGMVRKARGKDSLKVGGASVDLIYLGLDDVERRSRIEFSEVPRELTADSARFSLRLHPGEAHDFLHTARFEPGGGERPTLVAFQNCQEALVSRFQRAGTTTIFTANEQFNHWLARSTADLSMLISRLPEGPFPFAGVPWFSTPFGRDALITALQVLWIEPRVARGVLKALAAWQAVGFDPASDAEPGKILHESRQGEMANLGEVPFKQYYGSADSTPLFVMLAAAYWDRSGDDALMQSLWPNIERALAWIDTHGDIDGDGFVEYARKRPDGLANQGWKDSEDSISHADGSLALGPIALCEVQGYVFAAKKGAARIARRLGDEARASALEEQAESLRLKFEAAFWQDEMGTYALALDGAKKPCRVMSSNAGHVLFSGIADRERARRTAQVLLSKEMFSGWGIRTLGESERRFNPMSYHNGSIWPHDNALAAAGLALYGETDKVQRVFTGMFDAALFVDLHRLPELFCGFSRRAGQGPTLYPVACIPQAWASGSIFMLLQATMGLAVDAARSRVTFQQPTLPPSLPEIEIRGLKIGAAEVDLSLVRTHSGGTSVTVLRRQGNIEVTVLM